MAAKKTIFTIGIAIATLIVFAYGIATFYPDTPQDCYPDKYIDTKEECLQEGGKWMEEGGARPVSPTGEKFGYCDFQEKCDPIRNTHDRNIAIISFIIGGALLIYGIKGKKIAEQTTAGFVGGGLLIIGYGILAYWIHLENILRFFVLLALLVGLIWLGNKYKNFFK